MINELWDIIDRHKCYHGWEPAELELTEEERAILTSEVWDMVAPEDRPNIHEITHFGGIPIKIVEF